MLDVLLLSHTLPSSATMSSELPVLLYILLIFMAFQTVMLKWILLLHSTCLHPYPPL